MAFGLMSLIIWLKMIPTAETRAFGTWLRDVAMPYWALHGVARRGFFEQIDQVGTVLDTPRRTRLIARQTYAFRTASMIGWTGPGDKLAQHGFAALRDDCLNGDGLCHATITGDGAVVQDRFDLYDHAFALFALARVGTSDALQIARTMLDAMPAHPLGGFIDGPHETGQNANPHMHMFEAALALEAADDDPRWPALADTLARLCLRHMCHPTTGAVHEHFDDHWRMLPGDVGEIVEPGHQFEWAWLLAKWADRRKDAPGRSAAVQLWQIGRNHGIAANGMTLNALNADLKPTDRNHRLWTETERIKASVVFGTVRDVDAAIVALMAHFKTDVPGLWHETLGSDLTPEQAPARASSLYHIVGAAAELHRVGTL